MPQPNSFDLRRLPNDHAANCGEPMFLTTVLPADKAGHDQWTYECSSCAYAETKTVKFDES